MADLLGPICFWPNTPTSSFETYRPENTLTKLWQNYSLILKSRVFKLIGEGNLDHYHPFWLTGIQHRLICPHTHHQNVVVERKHRHIIELGLTLLHHASLPLKFWDSAFCPAVYLINRLPTASLKFEIPYHVLFQKLPDYSFLKTFWCSCFPLLRPYNNHKLDLGLMNVSSWGILHLIKGINVCLPLEEFISLRM